MIDWVIFVFNDEPVVREDYIKKFFVNLLAQVYLEIAGKGNMKEIIAKILWRKWKKPGKRRNW